MTLLLKKSPYYTCRVQNRTSIDASGRTELLASLYLVTRKVLLRRQCRIPAECVKYEERISVQEYFYCSSL
jgi:hypothetical protein